MESIGHVKGELVKNSTIFRTVYLLTHQFRNTLPYSHPFEGGSKILEKVDGAIVFAEVCFSYPKRPDALVLKNVSVTVPAGCTTAFVGSSGSGKILGVEDFGDRKKDRKYENMKNICSFPFFWALDWDAWCITETIIYQLIIISVKNTSQLGRLWCKLYTIECCIIWLIPLCEYSSIHIGPCPLSEIRQRGRKLLYQLPSEQSRMEVERSKRLYHLVVWPVFNLCFSLSDGLTFKEYHDQFASPLLWTRLRTSYFGWFLVLSW